MHDEKKHSPNSVVYICRTTRMMNKKPEAYNSNFFTMGCVSVSQRFSEGKCYTELDDAIKSVKGIPSHSGVWVIYKVSVPTDKIKSTKDKTKEIYIDENYEIKQNDIEGFYSKMVNNFEIFIKNEAFKSENPYITFSDKKFIPV